MWLKFGLAILRAVNTLAALLRERQLIRAGRVEARNEARDKADERVELADKARSNAADGPEPADDSYRQS